MKCPVCRCRMHPKRSKCSTCGYEFSFDEIKAAKRKRGLAIWIPVGILVLLIIASIILSFFPQPFVQTVKISADEIAYSDLLTVTVTCENYGMSDTVFTVPVYIDDNEIKTLTYFLSAEEKQSDDLFLSVADTSGPGEHILSVAAAEIPFTYLAPAEFEVSYEPDDQYLAAGESYQVVFSVTNSGPSTGVFDFTVSIDDTLFETDSITVKPEKTKDHASTISCDTPGEHLLKINNEAYPITFYETAALENGQKLMKTSVKGYSYFDITNHLTYDVIFYVTKTESPETAVAAQCIIAGERVKVRSFPHGEYLMSVQAGSAWLPELHRFGKDEKFYQSTEIKFDNRASGNTQHYEYITLELTTGNLSRYFDRVAEIPKIPES